MWKINFEQYKKLSGRDLYPQIFYEIGKKNHDILLFGADCVNSNGGGLFKENFPERTFDFGIAEANMVSVAAGLTKLGKIPVVGMFGFLVLRVAEQIKDDICYQNRNVKLFGTHIGVNMSAGGVTHHGTEDISVLRSFPNMTIIQPGSPREAIISMHEAILNFSGPVYFRLSHSITKEIYNGSEFNFKIGKANILQKGNDITLIASGGTVSLAQEVSKLLSQKGISARLINMHTLKPIDEEVIKQAAEETKGIVTIEDSNIAGGLGAAVTQVVCGSYPTKVKMIGLPKDIFTVIGPSEKEVWDYFGLNQENIINTVNSILS